MFQLRGSSVAECCPSTVLWELREDLWHCLKSRHVRKWSQHPRRCFRCLRSRARLERESRETVHGARGHLPLELPQLGVLFACVSGGRERKRIFNKPLATSSKTWGCQIPTRLRYCLRVYPHSNWGSRFLLIPCRPLLIPPSFSLPPPLLPPSSWSCSSHAINILSHQSPIQIPPPLPPSSSWSSSSSQVTSMLSLIYLPSSFKSCIS